MVLYFGSFKEGPDHYLMSSALILMWSAHCSCISILWQMQSIFTSSLRLLCQLPAEILSFDAIICLTSLRAHNHLLLSPIVLVLWFAGYPLCRSYFYASVLSFNAYCLIPWIKPVCLPFSVQRIFTISVTNFPSHLKNFMFAHCMWWSITFHSMNPFLELFMLTNQTKLNSFAADYRVVFLFWYVWEFSRIPATVLLYLLLFQNFWSFCIGAYLISLCE